MYQKLLQNWLLQYLCGLLGSETTCAGRTSPDPSGSAFRRERPQKTGHRSPPRHPVNLVAGHAIPADGDFEPPLPPWPEATGLRSRVSNLRSRLIVKANLDFHPAMPRFRSVSDNALHLQRPSFLDNALVGHKVDGSTGVVGTIARIQVTVLEQVDAHPKRSAQERSHPV